MRNGINAPFNSMKNDPIPNEHPSTSSNRQSKGNKKTDKETDYEKGLKKLHTAQLTSIKNIFSRFGIDMVLSEIIDGETTTIFKFSPAKHELHLHLYGLTSLSDEAAKSLSLIQGDLYFNEGLRLSDSAKLTLADHEHVFGPSLETVRGRV